MQEPTDSGVIDFCVLVVEDDYLIAFSLCEALTELGIRVLGPVATINQALQLLNSATRIGAALLDVDLGHEQAFAVADGLIARQIPFVFATGYDPHLFPVRFAGIACRQKPLQPLEEIRRLLKMPAPGRRA